MTDMNLIEEAYNKLYPGRDFKYKTDLIYSGRFKDYGANVRLSGNHIEFNLCRKWFPVDGEIKLGLIQELLLKLFKNKRKKSYYIDLYNNFIKNLHIAIPKNNIDPDLKESFDRVNERYFLGGVEMPNLEWGSHSTTKLGSYDFKTDTVSVSRIFENEELNYLDYIMYHELLHKVRKFKTNSSRTTYHDKKFKVLEGIYENQEQIEKELSKIARKARLKGFFGLKR
ncbi:hypothetical protein HN419_03970 [Candidatus Woesearchaeota archaeon]|jgi:hypothetical protein|nr:hypothetical protein [Candidatus Woesearchaeota archaeon]MBT7929186.1 hypothetical protein [Candidatus Peregrinibacteria bacterium]MBT3537965.1 hypothetical protein [Candidatus Woesearchaeota archaeon]MBT4697320.1 hypothetical protein [Candidatus Woesearchaeota archaeon]MBT4717040.1 hypothetical protein [Candidatus Woesearchaeota archaeon]